MTRRRLRSDRPLRFASDEKAIAAVEFALTLPILLVVFVGVTQVGEAVSISHKVTITARTITDLVTRENSPLSATELNTDLEAAAQVMAPYPSANVNVTVSEISTNSQGNATVDWSGSWPTSTNALKTGSSFSLPASLAGANVTVIYGQVSYAYTPTIGDNFIHPMTLSDHIYLYPRTGNCITGPADYPTSCP